MCFVAVFLPWANAEGASLMNYSFTRPDTISGVLGTQWGLPALNLAMAVTVMGVLMLAFGPGRPGVALGLLTAAAGVGIVLVARDASAAVAGALLYVGRKAATAPPSP